MTNMRFPHLAGGEDRSSLFIRARSGNPYVYRASGSVTPELDAAVQQLHWTS